MKEGQLGLVYEDGEIVLRQGEIGDCLFVVQEGRVEILVEAGGRQTRVNTAGQGELIGEMAIFQKEVRSATVRALGQARLLTVDKKNFFARINEDPSLAFRLVETMSKRVRELSQELARLKAALPAAERDES